ncbi:type I polyketide synthase [Anaerolineales bacterium HSG6]|nr:type I polyketide synthase [Anaerolineales bacterium HSG6]
MTIQSPPNKTLVEALRQSAFVIQELKTELATHTEPIAIIGLACRFPQADSPETFWELLAQRRDLMTDIPVNRWDIDAFYDPLPGTPGKMYTRQAGFIDALDQFDPQFFGMSAREARHLDPQQRLLLEASWEALERAGHPPDQLRNSQTGVFIGISGSDYRLLQRDPTQIHPYTMGGSGACFASGRLAYILGLQGPTLSVDTACSSSLVALHLACQSLRDGTSELALAGGVNVILVPDFSISGSQVQGFAPDGRSKTFDASGDGTSRGEGCVVLVLKRLSSAIAAQDPIVALIHGTAINHDGPSSGLTVPNKSAQETVIRTALSQGNIQPHEIGYIEAHGVGTPLGDPIELRALTTVFQDKQRSTPLFVGSAKTNIGHTEAAAGLTGVLKAVLAIQQAQIPPNLHFKTPTPHLDWENSPIQIPTAPTAWPTDRKLAGVSAFGASGTNAHVIIGEPLGSAGILPASAHSSEAFSNAEMSALENADHTGSAGILPASDPSWHILTLSAKTETALQNTAVRYHQFLNQHPATNLGDLCYTTQLGRTHFAHRLSVVAQSTAETQDLLAQFINKTEHPGLKQAYSPKHQTPQIAFLFTGQEAQYADMGRDLYETHPFFRQIIEQCDQIVSQQTGQSLLDTIYPQEANSEIPDRLNQTAMFALEYALAKLWLSWGVRPNLLLGHSLGEYVAACIAGVFSLEDGLRLVAERERLIRTLLPHQDIKTTGTAITISSEDEVKPIIDPYSDVSISAINAPNLTLLSGSKPSLEAVAQALRAHGKRVRMSPLPGLAHSPLLDPILDQFEAYVQTIPLALPQIPMISSLTGKFVTTELTRPHYWRDHLRQPVRFASAMTTLFEHGDPQTVIRALIEIGPKPQLLAMSQQCYTAWSKQISHDELREAKDEVSSSSNTLPLPDAKLVPLQGGGVASPLMLPSIRQGRSNWQQLLESLGDLHARGANIDWLSFHQGRSTTAQTERRKIILPTYPFQRQSYWLDDYSVPSQSSPPTSRLRPLLDRMTQSPLIKETIFETSFSVAVMPFLADHQVLNQVVVAGVCYLSMALNGAAEAFGDEACRLESVVFPRALILPENGEQTVQLVFSPLAVDGDSGSGFEFQIISVLPRSKRDLHVDDAYSVTTASPTLHATGRIMAGWKPALPVEPLNLETLFERCPEQVSIPTIYSSAQENGVFLGPQFQWLTDVRRNMSPEDAESVGKLQRPPGSASLSASGSAGFQPAPAHDDLFPPGLLDACFQVAGTTLGSTDDLIAPFGVESLQIYQPIKGDTWYCHAQLTKTADSPYKWNIQLLDETGQRLADIIGFEMRAVSSDAIQANTLWSNWLYQIRWQPQPVVGLNTPHGLPPHQLTSNTHWLLFVTGKTEHAPLEQALVTQLRQQGVQPILVRMDHALSQNESRPPSVLASRRHGGEVSPSLGVSTGGEVKPLPLAGGGWEGGELPSNHDLDAKAEPLPTLTINPDHPADYRQLLTDIPNIRGVIHLWSLEAETTPEILSDEAIQRSCGTALHLIQALLQTQSSPKLCFITQGGQTVTKADTVIGLSQAPLEGVVDTLILEHPELACVCIDLDSQPLTDYPSLASMVLADMKIAVPFTPNEHQIAFRQTETREIKRYVPRLTRLDMPPAPDYACQSDGTYLITGGLGGLGLLVARWLVEQGARRLVLVGRSAPQPHQQAEIETLQAMGAEVLLAQADVAVYNQIAQVVTDIESAYPLRGVIHAAGTLDDGVLLQQDWNRFEHVLAPKAMGAWNMHRLTETLPLDFFVLFSSVAGLFGNMGQANYTAANSFLNRLADYRQARQLPALSISWDTWSQVGAAAQRVKQEQTSMAQQGRGTVSPKQGLPILDRLLSQKHQGTVGVLAIDWQRFLAQSEPFFANLAPTTQPKQSDRLRVSSTFRVQLNQALPEARHELLSSHVRTMIATALGVGSPNDLDPTQPVMEMGLDSLMSVQLRNDLQQSLNYQLPAMLLFGHPTIESLVTYLHETLFPSETVAPPEVTPQPDIEAVSDDADVSTEALAKQFAAQLGVDWESFDER